MPHEWVARKHRLQSNADLENADLENTGLKNADLAI